MSNGYLPWLSAVTAAFELGAAVWVLRGPGRRGVLRLVAALLVVLAGYRIAEVWVCARPEDLLRSRLAFVDVVWLPTMGLHLVSRLRQRAARWMGGAVRASYAVAAGLSAYTLLSAEGVSGTVCSTVLATYHHSTLFHATFGVFYEVGLLALIYGAATTARDSASPHTRAHATDILLGTLGFVLPAFITQVAWRSIDPSLPSLMCHFAIVLALFLVRLVQRERLPVNAAESPLTSGI